MRLLPDGGMFLMEINVANQSQWRSRRVDRRRRHGRQMLQILLILLVTSPVPCHGQRSLLDTPSIKRIQPLIDAGQIKEARELLQEFHQHDSGNPHLLLSEAMILYKEGRYLDSVRILQGLLDKGRVNANVYKLIGLNLVAGGRREAAGPFFEDAIRLAPADTTAHYYLGMFHLDGGKRLDLAESAFREALRLAPDYIDAQLMLGLTKEQLGQDEEAIIWYRQAAQTSAHRERTASKPIEAPLLYLSRMLISRHRYPEVVPVLREALALNASSAEAHRLLGQSLFKLNQFADSLPHLEEAARLNPQDRSVHYLLMGVFKRLGRAEDARREGEIFRQLDGQTAEGGNAPP